MKSHGLCGFLLTGRYKLALLLYIRKLSIERKLQIFKCSKRNCKLRLAATNFKLSEGNPKPDILLFKVDEKGLIDASEPAIFIDCKLNVATPFTPAQQQIINNLNTDILVTYSTNKQLMNATIKIKVAKKLATNDNLELVLK